MSSLYNFIRNNDVEQIKELLNQGVVPDVYGLGEAILYNRLEIINLLLPYNIVHNLFLSEEKNSALILKNLLNYCIIANNKSLFLTLIEKISPDESTFSEAVNNPDIEIISTLINHGIVPTPNHFIQLVSNSLCTLEIINIIKEEINNNNY